MSNCHNVVFYICLVFMISACVAVQVSSQVLQTGNGIGLPEFINYRGLDNDNRLPRHTQEIVYTYSFNSCGNITEWGADMHQDRPYSLDFQVWRPSPTVNESTGTGCYSLVGNNRFTSISLIDGVARVTPSPQDYIQFQPNDVLGFYVESASIRGPDDIPNGLVVQTSPSRFTSELMWLASIAPSVATSQSGNCPYSVGSNGILNISTRAAPVISIAATTFSCASRSSSTSSSHKIRPTSSSTTIPIRGSIQSHADHRTIHLANNMSPTTTRPVVLASIGSNITPHQTTTDMGLSTSDSSASGQVSWLLIGSITAALVIAIVFIISLAVIITVCCLKGRSKKEDQRRQSVISDDEHYYDYVHTFGSTAQTPSCSYSKLHMGGSDHHPAHTVDTMKRNEAYALGNGRLESIEASQNVAYHSALDIL